MRYVAVIMILYSAPMVLSGSMELGHDLLHYLATHHHSHIHDHSHHDHHGIKDHGYGAPAEHHATHLENEHSEDSLPSLINFFLYLEAFDSYASNTSAHVATSPECASRIRNIDFPPLAPPPWSAFTLI